MKAIRLWLLFVLCAYQLGSTRSFSTDAGVNLLTGSYSGCSNGAGAGCAKGDYRWGPDATVSTSTYVLSASTGFFTSADLGKRGVALDWRADNIACPNRAGWACYTGVSCQFTVVAVNSPTSITVSPVTGCGASGMGFDASENAYWAVYSDDSTALQNALIAAASHTPKILDVPASYHGGIFHGSKIPDNVSIRCAAGASFNDPRLDSSTTWVFVFSGNYSSISGCIFSGTEPVSGGWFDLRREYNAMVADFGHDHNSLVDNRFQNVWSTYAVQAQGATNFTFSDNICTNTSQNCFQMNQTGGSPGDIVQKNVLVDSDLHVEDSANIRIPPSCVNEDRGCPNQSILISRNDISAILGCGYSRSQAALDLWFDAKAHLDCGTSASGARPQPHEYYGVVCSNNHVHGTNTALEPAPRTKYTTGYGEIMINNICDDGCNGSVSN